MKNTEQERNTEKNTEKAQAAIRKIVSCWRRYYDMMLVSYMGLVLVTFMFFYYDNNWNGPYHMLLFLLFSVSTFIYFLLLHRVMKIQKIQWEYNLNQYFSIDRLESMKAVANKDNLEEREQFENRLAQLNDRMLILNDKMDHMWANGKNSGKNK